MLELKQSEKKVMVITGGSNGIGKVTAEYFESCGWNVYSLSRKGKENGKIKHITCDVSLEQDCVDGFKKIFDITQKIDVVICCAGFGISGSIEETKLESAKSLFDVNFFGVHNTCKSALKYLKSGARIINISSVAARLPIAFQSFYSASKSALESYSDCLRAELRPFNIKVSCVLPGDTKTNFTSSRIKNLDESQKYLTRVANSVKKMEKDEINGMDPFCVAKLLFKISNSKKAYQSKTVGLKNKIFVFLAKLTPKKFVNWILTKLYA